MTSFRGRRIEVRYLNFFEKKLSFFFNLQNEETEDGEIPYLLNMSYSSLDLKTLAMRTIIKCKLKTERSMNFHYLPKTLSAEMDNFSKLLGKYRAIEGRQDIWKTENGKIQLIDQYSFDYENWFSSDNTNPLREVGEKRRDERRPFLVNIILESHVHGRLAILVSKSECFYYETEHLVELKDRVVWMGLKDKCFKQEFFCNDKLMIVFWNIIDNKWQGIDSASEFYFEGDYLIWKKYNVLNMLFQIVTEYKMERIVCKFVKC